MSLWDDRAHELLTRVASSDPTPGGGSTAALSGAFGLALVSMALEVSARHKNAHADVQVVLDRVRQELPRLRVSADADVQAFDGFMIALALPRSSDEEQVARREALFAAALTASEVPLAAAEQLVASLALAEAAASIAAKNVVSDVGAGAALLGGALRATLLSVDINLPHVAPQARAALVWRRDALRARGEALERGVLRAVSARLQP